MCIRDRVSYEIIKEAIENANFIRFYFDPVVQNEYGGPDDRWS